MATQARNQNPTKPAKQTPAKKTTPRKTTAKKASAPAPKPAVKKAPRKAPVNTATVTEQAATHAALAAAALALPIPVRTWNGSTAHLTDGTLLIHNPSPDRTFTAHIACRHGAIHNWPINSHTDLREARALTHACERRHSTPTTDGTELDWDKAITRGVGAVAQPKPSAVLQLREGIRRAEATKADTQPLDTSEIAGRQPRALGDELTHSDAGVTDTQPLSHDEIAEGLAQRADNDQMKEHPQP